MIFGIGIDLVKIDRVKNSIERFGKKFKKRICTSHELELSDKLSDGSLSFFSFFAKRFAAKEAFAKAWGTGIGKSLSFLNLEILNDDLGRPYVLYIVDKRDILKEKGYIAHLSISDTDEYAIAQVIIEKAAN